MNSKICVVGCGWLGLSLAKKLVAQGHIVHGSTTSKEKLPQLEKAQIIPFLIQLSSEGVSGKIASCLNGCQTLIVNIPPGLRKNPENDYVKQMSHFVKHVEDSQIKQVLFIGSTSVYDDDKNFSVITENSPTSTSKTPLKLLEVEALFAKNKKFKTTILRFSGLFGKERHPANYLSGKTNLKNGDAPVNLIHREDCVAIIISVVQNNLWETTINASTPSHPTKATYYTAVCEILKIPVPKFDTTTISKGKIIDSTKLVQLLNYEFQVRI
nr:NAD(P)H-binding protein [uncultured Psychroserpens sp.]